ncbi:MAG: hypothetical protein JXA25_15205 [Anaerolineales bacterium]|nr:hypothetical protein [Anaerolineales bacterium]
MYKRLIYPIFIIFLLVLSGCQKPSSEPDLVYGLTLSPTGIDPHLNASSELGIPLQSVYDTLIFRDPANGNFVPGLAESWLISSDELTYTFSLRTDVSFHDGTQFNASAVRTNLDRILNPDNHSQKAFSLLGPLESATVEDEYTIALHLRTPYGALLDALSQVYLGMASPSALEEWGTEYQFHQVGTGPYRFVEYIPENHILLERNEAYAWAPSFINVSDHPPQRIEFRFYADPATRALALESGEVDIMGEIPMHDARRLSATDSFDLLAVPIPGQPLQYFFNTTLSPTDDPLVREALFQGIDRAAIVETIFGSSSPPAGDVVSASMQTFPTATRFGETDSGIAQELLDQAGWLLDEESGVRKKDGVPIFIRIAAPTWGMNPEVCQLMRADWERLGIQVEIHVMPGFGQLKEAHDAHEYQLIGINFFGTDPAFLSSFYSSDGLYNWSNVKNPELDSWLQTAASLQPELPERAEIYSAAANSIRDQVLILPVRDYVNLVLKRQSVHGLRYSAEGWFPLLIELSIES